jgi:integrase
MRSTGESNLHRAKVQCEAFVRIAEEEGRPDTTKEHLLRIVDDTLRRLGQEPVQTPTVKGYLEKWLANQAGSISESTHYKYTQIVRDFLASLGSRASLKLSQITDADIVSFRDTLLAGGRSAQTVNFVVRQVLKLPFKMAVESGLLDRNPVALVKMLRGTKATKGTFSPEQIGKLLATVEGDWRGLILAGYYTGARLTDLSRLRWASVDLEEKTITFTQGKTGGVVKIPIHPELEAWLRLAPRQPSRGAGGEPVFPALCARAANGQTGLSHTFTRLLQQAGIVSENIRERKGQFGRSVSALSFHSLRHSFNTHLANAGVSQEQRQLLTGHMSAKVNDVYTHHKMETLRSAVGKLPSIS